MSWFAEKPDDVELAARIALARWQILKAENDRISDYEFACLLVDIAESMKKGLQTFLLNRMRADIAETFGPVQQPGQPGQ